MGKPAARMGDSCAHGGTIVLGFPQVLIGGQPAARITDMHVCPMVTGVVPHVGGPILPPGGIGVLIGSIPAARMGDMVTCVGPPDVIVKGQMTVLIGEIASGGGGGAGEGGSGGGGGGGGGSLAKAVAAALMAGSRALAFSFSSSTAIAAAAAAVSQAGGDADTAGPESEGGHWVRFEFKDQAGLPVTAVPCDYERPDGRVSRTFLDAEGALDERGLEETGNCTVTLLDVSNARWSAEEAKPDEALTMTADAEGIEDGTAATLTVFRRDLAGTDIPVARIETEVKDAVIEGEWTFEAPEGDESSDGYSKPEFFFVAAAAGLDAWSPVLPAAVWADIVLEDEEGNAIGDEEYRATLSTGEIRSGTLDGKGRARLEDIPAGRVTIEFPNRAPGAANA